MDPSYEDYLDETITKRYRQLELEVMRDIVRRIKKTEKITSSADWQIMRLTIMGNSPEEIRKKITEVSEMSEGDVQKLFDDVIDKEYTRSADLYKEVGAEFIPYEQNHELQQLTQALITQSNNELKSITGTTGFMLDYGDGQGLRFTPHTQVFDEYLNNAVMGIATGTFDYNTMIRKVVTQMTNSGLRTVNYASGKTDRVDVAARRAVMTGLSQLTGKISDENAKALNTDHFEVAWHAGARPTHQEWQGRVWSRKELVDVCGLGSVTGLLGANCYHDYYPFIPGISERMYSDEWLDEMNKEENTPKTFMGKEYTAYEARQRQRYLERCMRAQREKVELLKEGGADKDEVMLARCKYQAQLDEYKRFSKVMKLPVQRERIYYDMRGRIAPTKKQMEKFFEEQAKKKEAKQTEADKHKERAEESRREDMDKRSEIQKIIDLAKATGATMSGIRDDLSMEELQALQRYIGFDSYVLNEKLRNWDKPGYEMTEDERQWARNLDLALFKLPDYTGIVYRSISTNRMMNEDAFNQRYQPGKIVIEHNYTSASKEYAYDDSFEYQFVIKAKHGRDISELNPDEREVLFKRGSFFIVVDRKGNTIYLEEL